MVFNTKQKVMMSCVWLEIQRYEIEIEEIESLNFQQLFVLKFL